MKTSTIHFSKSCFFAISVLFVFMGGCVQLNNSKPNDGDEKDMYDGPALAAKFEFERTKDPATGRVPRERLLDAIQQTIDSKNAYSSAIGGLAWNERGPNSDLPGPSNGNTRANNDFSSGRMRALLVDKSDPTGKTVFAAGISGGLWKTTDITSPTASWAVINDNLSNLAISDITQDPRPGFQNIMYFCTGEAYFNIGSVQGNGVFKSTDNGATWTYLPSTSTYVFGTRILCDYLGNIYLGTRSGLFRSTVASGGAAWTDITPTGLSTSICDLEISSTTAAGRLHVVAGIFTTQAYRYTDIPVTVAAATWTSPVTAFPSFSNRAEICVSGSTLYSLVADASNEVPTIYKSTDGGANWAACATSPTAGWASGQGWYALACDIDPSSGGLTCIVGGLDTWKTTNGGTTWSQISTWVGVTPIPQYVHADVHKILFYDSGNKLLFGSDGGIFFSSDKGVSIKDRNKGIRIKQFYSCAIHPSTTDYFLAGAQDNGVHQFNNAGLSNTVEVTGGDGAFVAIDQNEPAFQFGSYVFNVYRRSINSGATWTTVTLNSATGQFINPFDYDNTANIMYCGDIASNFRRWTDPQTGSTSAVVNITSIVGSVTAVSVSPYTAHKVFFGTSSGRVVQVDGANTIASGSAGTDRSTGLPGGTVSCINFGTDDLNLIMCESNYGINNVWVSTNGGVSWTAIDGTLPDMPVRWCMFYPGSNTKAYIATETGVWETDLISGGATVWNANPSFPTVRTEMIKYRSSDRTIAAATHGRGLWTAVIPTVATADLSFQTATASETESTTFTSSCRGYTDYTKYMVIANSPTGTGTVTLGIAGGATATSGVDYAITTNGNFAAPSLTLSFASGATTPQPFTIRVYDDNAVESAETFTINYTVSGGTAAPGVSNQTLAFTINDNDATPITAGTGSFSVGTAAFALASQSPFRGTQSTYRIQHLYTAAELIAAGITTARNFTNMTLYVSTKSSTIPYTGFKISMGNTAATTLNTGFRGPSFTTVFSPAFYSTVAGANLFTFTTPFAWDGVSNVVIDYCWANAGANLDDLLEGNSAPLGAGVRASTYVTTNPASPCVALATSVSDARPRATFGTSITGTPVSTALSSTKTAYLGPLDDVYYYDASGNIIARIKNLTAFDYGCTQVIIDRAGSASSAFWNNATANYLLSKTCKVIPATNTASGSYQITLYYTAAEVAGWEAATGRTWAASTMQVAKVSNGFFVPDVTPAAPHIADVSLVTGTKGTLGSDFTIRGDFSSTGFSGFGAGVPGNALLTSDFRTKATGDFTDGLIWQYNNEGVGYVDALQAPSADNNVNIQATHTVLLNAAFTINTGKTLTVNGTLNCGTNTVSGAGSFVTAAASTMGIGSTAGITASGATGNIQTTTRTFASTGNYSYNGTANQATGNGLPATVNNLVIANTGAALNNIVTMGGALTVNGSSTLTSGILSIGSNTLTLNGTVSGSGTLTGTASGGLSTSNLVIGGAALNQTLNFTQTSAATRSLNDLTLNAGSSATLGNALDVYGTIALTTSTLNLNTQNLTLKSNTTNTARIADLTGSTLSGATNVTVERFIKLRAPGTGAGTGTNGRAYRLLAPTVNTTGTMRANWMEGGMVTTVGGTSNPVANYGTHITGAGGNTNFFDVTGSNAASAYFTTNGVAPTYTAVGSTQVGTGISTMNALTGYFLYIRGDRSMDLTLPLAVGTMPTSSTTLRTTGSLLTGTKTSFTNPFIGGAGALNLVTNPYASPIDWSLVQPACANIGTAYTLWDPNVGTRGGFVTVTTAGVVSGGGTATKFIQSGQAFFVQASGAAVPAVSIQESHKAAGNNNTVFIVPPPPTESFRTDLYFTETNGYRRVADGVIALFDNQYSPAIDGDDAFEINNWDENIAVARDGKHLAIEARPVIAKSDELPLFMNNMKQQGYEFEFTPSAFTNTGLKAELIDNFLGTRTLLSVTSPTVVSFTVTANAASATTDRFKVVFGGFGSPTGVDVITLKANEQNAEVQVSWTSKTETDMLTYEVEKSSYGNSFSKVNTTNAIGNSSNPVNYNWFDTKPNIGTNFYRVKGIDKAGNVRYSNIGRVLYGKGEPAIVVYPNPTEGNFFKMDMYNLVKGTYLLNLYNDMGQLIYTEQLQHDGSQATKTINLKGEVVKGTYQLQLSNDNGFQTTQKIIKN